MHLPLLMWTCKFGMPCVCLCVLLLLLLLQVWLHPSSVLSDLTAAQLHHQHVIYLEKTKTTRVRNSAAANGPEDFKHRGTAS